jgi:hypothetical protein
MKLMIFLNSKLSLYLKKKLNSLRENLKKIKKLSHKMKIWKLRNKKMHLIFLVNFSLIGKLRKNKISKKINVKK